MLQKILIITPLGLVVFLVAFLLVRTFTFPVETTAANTSAKKINISTENLLERFSGGIKIRTVSGKIPTEEQKLAYESFLNYIKESYPSVFENEGFDIQRVDDYALIIRWRGRNTDLEPMLFTGHYDVVGVSENTVKDWKYPPFSATIEGDKIIGRGTLDDKASVFAHLEALDYLVKSGFKPSRDIVWAFSYNEEVGGKGAETIARTLNTADARYFFVLDEGGRVQISEKDNSQIAYIGISEKGRAVLKIKIKEKGGHASQPSKTTSVTQLAKLINEFSNHPMKPVLIKQTEDYLVQMFSTYDFWTRLLIANRDILEPVLLWKLSQNKQDNARIRTTMAITMLEGSDTINIIPEYAEFTADFRILPTQNLRDVEDYVTKTVKRVLPKADCFVDVLMEIEPSHISKTDSKAFNALRKQINNSYPEAKILPFMVLAGTDARCYEVLSENVYRFLPVAVTQSELDLMHGINEHLTIKNFENMTTFYIGLIRSNG